MDYLCPDDVIHANDVIDWREKHSVFAHHRTNVRGDEAIWTFDNDFSSKYEHLFNYLSHVLLKNYIISNFMKMEFLHLKLF